MDAELSSKRAEVYRFLARALHDEPAKDFLLRLAEPGFTKGVEGLKSQAPLVDLTVGLAKVADYLQKEGPEEVYKKLRFEYADLFLNAGPNPVFPYESVYLNREPVVIRGAVAQVRQAYRAFDVKKDPAYYELDDHIAVELDFLAYLLDKAGQGDEAAFKGHIEFLRQHLLNWVVEFVAVLSGAAQSPYYQGLAELLMSFLFQERMYLFNVESGTSPNQPYLETLNLMVPILKELGLSGYSTLSPGALPEEGLKTYPTHCYICLGLCGQTVRVKDGIIQGITGLAGDPKGGGRLCIKGGNAHLQAYSAYRLKTPLIKEEGRFRKASWDEALDYVARRLKELDPATVGYHRGNDYNAWLHEAVMAAYGCPHKVTHRVMCDNPIRMANEYNLNDKRPWIDYRQSDFVILFGINEFATSGGQRKLGLLKEALKRGCKLVAVDPRRSETAAAATEWIPIKPATDGALALAMCYVIVKNELYDREFVENWTYGFEDFKRRLLGEEDGQPRSPEWAEKICGVPALTIERLGLEFGYADHPAALCWTGVSQSPNAVYATMAIMALNGLKGTFDAPGGPSLPFKRKLSSPWGEGQPKPPNNAPKVKLNEGRIWSGWWPAYLEEQVDQGKIKALVCYFGDPVLSCGNEDSIVRAIKKMDFRVAIDIFMSNTASLSDVVLPDCTYLEQSRVVPDWTYEAFISLFQRVIDPLYDSRPIWWIFTELARRLGLGEYFPWKDEEEFIRNQLRGLPVTLEELKKRGYYITDPHEYFKYKKWGSLNPPEGYGSSGKTPTGKYNFKHPVAEKKGIDPLPDYKEPWEDWPDLKPDEEYPLILGYFRVLEHEHCGTMNNIQLMKQRGSNPLWINVIDAKLRGLKDGDQVVVKSPWGQFETRVRVTWNIRQGVVAAAGGFGHWRGLEADPKYPRFWGTGTTKVMKPACSCLYSGTPPLKFNKVQVIKKEGS